MKLKTHGEFILGLAFVAFGLVYFIAACMVPESAVMDLGPDVLPKVIALFTIVLGAMQTMVGYKHMKKVTSFQDKATEEQQEEEKLEYWRVIATILSFVVYVNLIETVGFLIMTFIYLVVQMNILSVKEERNQILFVALSLITSVAVFYLFRNGFSVMIPAGILG